jgi:phage/plasmid primase-like uncharacterized protein
MDKLQVDNLRNQIDLRAIAASYSTLSGREGDRLRKGPCPRCGGKDRFEVHQDKFFCRQCKPAESGKGKHDCFDFVQWMGFASNFIEAYEWLARYAGSPSSVRPSTPPPAAPLPALNWQDATWQQKAQTEARSAVDCLAKAVTGKPGRDYLTSRGIEQATWEACGVGWGEGWNAGIGATAPAIVLPWYAEDGRITHIQYRFVDGQGQRFGRFAYPKSKDGFKGDAILYRTPARGSDALIICEGEINALSLWQATSYDVASFGSQSVTAATKQAIADLAQRYARVLVWADKGSVAAELAQLIGDHAKPVKSPKGKDGNDLLQMGMLTAMIERLLPSPCQAEPVTEPAAEPDLTSLVGQTVDSATWAALQQQLKMPDYEGWTLHARAEGDGWHIYQLHVAPLADDAVTPKKGLTVGVALTVR